ncbi:diguanylate cyclase [Teredinibacter haidensis]|uniref:diguanylate cyclase n=1 Tax=Teredinibacter haidensis TaxID=2731755 RepID=UPI000948E8F9|nr:diguanylate cyclase [Teredinibacter haidensis]
MKILLVEDSPTLRYATSTYIRQAGHEPIIATCGEEALQVVDNTPVDMVIMDVEMPGLDGFETTRLIREWLGDHWVPIIFVTGCNDEKSLKEGIEAGGDDYLIKPVSSVILTAKIRAMGRIATMRDQLNEANKELLFLSEKDGLSGLYNRRTFDTKAEEHWKLSTRTQEPLSILLMDIDHFKLYNDTYGHQSGDECIRLISTAIKRCVNRPGDLVGRYGGEEFIALLPNTTEEGALHVAEHIRKTIEALRLKHRGLTQNDRVTISIGASVTNVTTGTSLSHQVAMADQALYKSKHKGRNRVTLATYTPNACVLAVDNDQNSLAALEETLDGHCALVTSQSKEESLLLVSELKPDIILINAHLLDTNGYEICQALKGNDKTNETPVILTSDGEKEELESFSKKFHANAYLQKPFNTHQLLAKIRLYLSK